MTDDERERILNRLREAARDLRNNVDPRLIPASGLVLGYAVKGAREGGSVAGIRIHGPDAGDTGGQDAASSGAFGADPDIARIILTAMHFDPKIRSAAVLRCTGPVYRQAENLFLEVPVFDAAREPPGISTQDWGVASCCGKDGVPETIANRPAPGKPAYLRFFGESPEDVATNIIMLSNRVINIEIQDRSEWE